MGSLRLGVEQVPDRQQISGQVAKSVCKSFYVQPREINGFYSRSIILKRISNCYFENHKWFLLGALVCFPSFKRAMSTCHWDFESLLLYLVFVCLSRTILPAKCFPFLPFIYLVSHSVLKSGILCTSRLPMGMRNCFSLFVWECHHVFLSITLMLFAVFCVIEHCGRLGMQHLLYWFLARTWRKINEKFFPLSLCAFRKILIFTEKVQVTGRHVFDWIYL
jgi:hypothetical protein